MAAGRSPSLNHAPDGTELGGWAVFRGVVYEFDQGGRRRQLLYQTARDALYSAVVDIHKGRAAPVAIRRGDKVLADAAKIQRAYVACKADLDAEPMRVPRALLALAARQ